MFTTPLSSTQIDAYNTSGASNKDSTDPKAAQDKFLTMLTAQMNNQDPLNPMDNAQLTSQLAQINTVSGIQQLNQTMTSMAAHFAGMQSLQGVSLIGRTALVESNTPLVQEGHAYGGFDLAGAADSVRVDVLGKAGQVLATSQLGPQAAGQGFFEVPLDGVDPAAVGSFSVVASSGGRAAESRPIAFMPIASVGMAGGAMKLTAQNGQSFGYDQVLGYR